MSRPILPEEERKEVWCARLHPSTRKGVNKLMKRYNMDRTRLTEYAFFLLFTHGGAKKPEGEFEVYERIRDTSRRKQRVSE